VMHRVLLGEDGNAVGFDHLPKGRIGNGQIPLIVKLGYFRTALNKIHFMRVCFECPSVVLAHSKQRLGLLGVSSKPWCCEHRDNVKHHQTDQYWFPLDPIHDDIMAPLPVSGNDYFLESDKMSHGNRDTLTEARFCYMVSCAYAQQAHVRAAREVLRASCRNRSPIPKAIESYEDLPRGQI
jgi:hypothetical protein